jgi:hypothetical protein
VSTCVRTIKAEKEGLEVVVRVDELWLHPLTSFMLFKEVAGMLPFCSCNCYLLVRGEISKSYIIRRNDNEAPDQPTHR